MMKMILETDKGEIELGGRTLIFALDDTGHEMFSDRKYPIFGIGGCSFLVSDYQLLIEEPFNYMCNKYFPNLLRPWHTTDIIKSITSEQIKAINHLFAYYNFARLAVTMTINTIKNSEFENIRIITGSLINAIKEITQRVNPERTDFDRIFVIVEDSERTRELIIAGLTGYKINTGKREIQIELGVMPKKASSPALELADLIIHTAGSQTKHRLMGKNGPHPSFEIVFAQNDSRPSSFKEITRIENI